MKVLYISSAPSKHEFEFLQGKVKAENMNNNYGMPEASFKFHNLIIDGLRENDCDVYSLIGVPISHKTHDLLFYKKKKEIDKNVIYHHVPTINLPILKQLIICFLVFIVGFFWLLNNRKEDKFIFFDATYITLLPIINLLTFFFSCNKIGIVCDVYSYMAEVKDARKNSKSIYRFIQKFIKGQYRKLDGYIFLTEEMSKLEPFKNKPFKVIEGIVDTSSNNNIEKHKYVMYAGALREEYGAKRLVDAFHNAKELDFELLLFGNGDYVKEIEKISKEDKRIKYMGKKNLEEIREYEEGAYLLINPRPIDGEFTKYSFPSKNMEYMSSGTPLLTSKLPGMPEEYNDYVYLIEENNTESLTMSLINILKKNINELTEVGIKAKIFVESNKNKKVQSKKIIVLNGEINEKKQQKKII